MINGLVLVLLAYFDCSREACGGKSTWNKILLKKLTKFCLLWQNNMCSFSVTEINSTVKWFADISRNMAPVALHCLMLGFRTSVSNLSFVHRQNRGKERGPSFPRPHACAYLSLLAPWLWNLKDEWPSEECPASSEILECDSGMKCIREQHIPSRWTCWGLWGGWTRRKGVVGRDVRAKDWIAQQSGARTFLQSSPEEGGEGLGLVLLQD